MERIPGSYRTVRDSLGGRFERRAWVKVRYFWDRSLAAPKGRAIKAQGNALGSIQCETMRALKGRHKPIAPLQGLHSSRPPNPRALPWAGLLRPFRAVRQRLHPSTCPHPSTRLPSACLYVHRSLSAHISELGNASADSVTYPLQRRIDGDACFSTPPTRMMEIGRWFGLRHSERVAQPGTELYLL